MLKAVTSTAVAAMIVLSASVAVVKPVQAQDLALNLCTYVQGDDRTRMRQRIREERVRLRQVYDGVRCNGLSLIQFALTSGSDDIGVFITSQLPGSTLESSGELEWAESNGYGSTDTVQAMRARIE